MSLQLSGTHVALYTPFAADGSVDMDAYRALAERVASAGAGLVPCGTTGETPTLTPDEVAACIAAAVEVAAGRVPVIAGTGSNSTAKTIKDTRRAKQLGADAALVVTPYYNKPPQCSLLAHYRAVADDGGLPVVLYNVPGRTGCNMLAETSLALAEHEQIVAVKEAAGSLAQIEEIARHMPAGFSLLSGDDAMTMPLVLAGGHGVISVAGNVVPGLMRALVEACLAGDVSRARARHYALVPLFNALFATTNPIPVKRAAALMGHCRPDLRLPLTADACTPAMVDALGSALAQAGVAL
jgi:4-hydroxy-tetrahydrodipicolinate synthase